MKRSFKERDWGEIQEFYDECGSMNATYGKFKTTHSTMLKAEKCGLFKRKRKKEVMSSLKVSDVTIKKWAKIYGLK